MRHARELTLERRARTRLRGLVALLAAALLLASSLTRRSPSATEHGRPNARAGESAIARPSPEALSRSLNVDPDLSLLLALHAVDLSATLDLAGAVRDRRRRSTGRCRQAGVEYPAEDGSDGRSSPDRVRGRVGVYDLPCRQRSRTRLGRRSVEHARRQTECERYLRQPQSVRRFRTPSRSDIEAEPVRAASRTSEGQPLAGTRGHPLRWPRCERVRDGFEKSSQPFTDANRHRWSASSGTPLLRPSDCVADSIAAGHPPDVTPSLTRPSAVRDFARQGHLINIWTYLDIEPAEDGTTVRSLISLGTLGEDGSWPASDRNDVRRILEKVDPEEHRFSSQCRNSSEASHPGSSVRGTDSSR